MFNGLFQNCYYIGNNFNCILYGVELVLYFKSMQGLLRLGSSRTRMEKFFLFYTNAGLFLITIFVATESFFGEEMWIINADFPGGSAAYLEQFASVWYQTMGTTATVTLNLLSDGLMIYRCYIIWNDWRIIVFPGITYLGTLALGILVLVTSGAPSGDFFAGLAAKINTAYAATSIGLNVLITTLILGRIVYVSRMSRRMFGMGVSRSYMTAASIMVESAFPFALSGVAYLISFGTQHESDILFLSIYTMFTVVSPQMLILRAVEGRAIRRGDVASSTAYGGSTAGSGYGFRRPVNVPLPTSTTDNLDNDYVLAIKKTTVTETSKATDTFTSKV